MMNKCLSQSKTNQYARIASVFFIVFLLFGMRAYSQTATCAGAPNIPVNAGACAASGPYAITWNTIAGAISAPAPLAPCPTTNLTSNAWGTFTATGTTTTISYHHGNRDAVLWIYSGTCPGALTQIACADANTNGPTTESVTISTVIGQQYFVRVARKAAAGNITTGTICVSNAPVPANDEPCTASPLTNPVPTSCAYTAATTMGATPSITPIPPAPGCGNYIGNDIWFSVVVPASGKITIDTRAGLTAPPSYNLVDGGMALYTGACGALTLVACDDNSSTNPSSMPSISATGLVAGSTVYIRFWANNINSFGSFDICVYDVPPACNVWDNPCTTPFTLPVNATCGAGSGPFNNTCATPTAGVANPSCAPFSYSGGDVWFRVIVPASGQITLQGIAVGGAGALLAGSMALYSAPVCSGPYTELYCDGPGFFSPMPQINASGLTPGATLYVRFWGWFGLRGTFRLCAYTSCAALPANDNCSGAIPLTLGGSCAINKTNVCASPSTGVSAPGCGNYNGGDVWFSVTVPASGTITATGAAGTLTDGALAIYSGACGSLTLLGCDDNSGPGASPQLTLSGLAAGTIYIRYWRYGGGTGGTFGLCVSDPCPGGTPPNDLPCNASFLPYGIFIAGSNGCASNVSDPASLPGCFINGGAAQWNTVWYRFIATSTCTKIKTATGTLNNTQIAVYSGAGGCSALGTPIACNDDFQPCGSGSFSYSYSQLQVNTTVGTTYYIMVDGSNGQTGSFSIQIIDGGTWPGCSINFPPVAGQDCALPIPVCNDTVSVPNPGFQAVGNICDFAPPSPCTTDGNLGCSPGGGNPCTTSCLCSGERGSGWYAITIGGLAPSFLEFTILPNDYTGTAFAETDYDFALFGPNPSCGALNNPVRCSYSPLGVTGLNGPTINQAPPVYAPNFNGGFRERLSVNPGEVYYLNVSNFSISNSGFMLTFPNPAVIASTVPPGGTVIWTGAVSTNWHDANNWGGCLIPDCTINVVIPSFPVNQPVISTGGNASCRSINISLGASLTLSNPNQLMVCDNYTNDGTFTAGNATTVVFEDICFGCPAGGINHNQVMNGSMTGANKFNNVTVNKPNAFKVTTNQDVDMAGNFLISGAAGAGNFDATGKYHKVAGNFTVSTAPSLTSYTPSTVLEFNGPVAPLLNQNYYNRGLLDSVVMNQTAGPVKSVTLQDHGLAGFAWMQIGGTTNAGTLTFANGKIIAGITGNNRVDVFNRIAAAVSAGNVNSYVEGALRRYMPNTGGIGSYNFPVGSAAKGYQRINFNLTAALPNTISYWNVYFDNAAPATNTALGMECSSDYHNGISALDNGFWNVESNPSSLASGTMHVTNYNRTYFNQAGAGWTVMFNNTTNNIATNWLLNPFPASPCTTPPVTTVLRNNLNVPVLFTGNPVWFGTAQSVTPLPVELLSFDAKSLKSSILLKWVTASEKNNRGFELEKTTTPPDNFRKIAWVDGNGSSTMTNYYNFEDKEVKGAMNYYYRLKQIDYNGEYEYSKIVASNIGEGAITFNVLPNPYAGTTNITYNLKQSGKVKLEVLNVMGQKIITLADDIQEAGNYQFTFSAQALDYAAGIYTVRFQINDQIFTKRIVETE